MNGYFTDVDNFVSALEPFTPTVFLAGQELAGYLVSQEVPVEQAGLIAGTVGSADAENPEDGYEHSITVLGTLNVQNGTLFKMDDTITAYWKGIIVKGIADFQNVTITDAER